MATGYSRYIPMISLAGDLLLLFIFFIVGFLHYYHSGFPDEKYILFFLYLMAMWTTLYYIFGGNEISRHTHKFLILTTYVKIIVFFFFLFLMYFQVTELAYYPRDSIKFLFPVFFFCIITWKFILYFTLLYYRKKGFNYRNVISMGDSPDLRQLISFLIQDRWHGYRYLGNVSLQPSGQSSQDLGKFADLPHLMKSLQVDDIFISADEMNEDTRQQLAEWLIVYPAGLNIVPDLGAFSFQNLELINFGNTPVLQIHPGPLSLWYNKWIKRLFDLIFSIGVIIFLLSWLIPLLWVIDLLTDRQGVFFTQERTSILHRSFTIIKFRSMYQNGDADLRQAKKDDDRITPLGRLLRKTCVDELPQFINVLLGDMSVVGPRPHMIRHTEDYQKVVQSFMLRHTVKPGVTGLAQCKGYRGEIRSKEEIKKRVEHDIAYIRHWSLSLDLRIILMTILVIIRGK